MDGWMDRKKDRKIFIIRNWLRRLRPHISEPREGGTTACEKPALHVRAAGDVPRALSSTSKGNSEVVVIVGWKCRDLGNVKGSSL